MGNKERAKRNRTLTLTEEERGAYGRNLIRLTSPVSSCDIENRTINQDLLSALGFLPASFADLLFLDPPYNLDKVFNATKFKKTSLEAYQEWVESWFPSLMRVLKPHASVYICSDWQSSTAIHRVASKYLIVRNRITWERETGKTCGKAHPCQL
jgi:site-specific DNA-methyltransferase (adenine-specific)